MRNQKLIVVILSVLSLAVVTTGCDNSAPEGQQQEQSESPPWALDLTAKLNDISNWKIISGKWQLTPEGRTRGVGDSRIVFEPKLPSDFILSFRMNVIDGMRPRVF